MSIFSYQENGAERQTLVLMGSLENVQKELSGTTTGENIIIEALNVHLGYKQETP